MATFAKTDHRFSTSDWFTSNYAVSTNSERERKASHDIRQSSKYTRNETDNKTVWDQHDNNTRLDDRVTEIRELKDLLERTVENLDAEIKNLNEAKDLVEQILDHRVGLANHINVENLVSREGRRTVDVVADMVEVQLFKERELLESIKQRFQGKIDEAFEHLCILQDVRHQILADLQNKNITLDIDVEQYNLNIDSPGLSFKPNPTRRPKGTLNVKQWADFCRYNEKRADAETVYSIRLREAILHTLQQCTGDLESQHVASAYELRHRIHEFEMALDELLYQKKLTEREISETEAEIRRLEEAIEMKRKYTKVAQTRLENRLYRPNEELCHDNVQFGLIDEVKQLAATLQTLEDKKRQSQHALHCLEQNLHRLNEEIGVKQNSLAIDRQCLASRDKLLPLYPLSETSYNRQLVGIDRDKMQVLPY